MRAFLVTLALAAGLLAGCATPAPQPRDEFPAYLFADAGFAPPSEPIDAAQIFALSDEMRRYVASSEMAALVRAHGTQRALFEALYQRRQLKLEYETVRTRNAAEAFEARAGNCLSLAIMAAAFAKELGLQVRYQSAYLDEAWIRKGDLLLRSGHVNITLGGRLEQRLDPFMQTMTIDFLPPAEIRSLRTQEIPESLVVAMFMNNRAIEALSQDRLDDAYAWTRASVRANPGFLAALNTLGVIYTRRDLLDPAAAALNYVLAHDPAHTRALANLVEVRQRQGLEGEAAELRARLARLEPRPPLHYFNLGLAAIQREDYLAARALFSKEIARGDTEAAVHYWLSVANYRLGDVEQARHELQLATEASASRDQRALYSAKLEWLRARQPN